MFLIFNFFKKNLSFISILYIIDSIFINHIYKTFDELNIKSQHIDENSLLSQVPTQYLMNRILNLSNYRCI